jgi:branched-subunit amino acid ABC-type transport system permease component
MSASSIITTLGISILLVYGITKILDFYGIGINIYGSYIAFYFFLLISSFVLPRQYFKLKLLNT